MKTLLINNADKESGAAKAAIRLLAGLNRGGIEASCYVQRKFGDSSTIIGPETLFGRVMGFARPTIEEILTRTSPARTNGLFSPAIIPDRLAEKIKLFSPDVIHLHWVAKMMRIESLSRFNRPVVWTLHDSWPFTGGCHLPQNCTRYCESCGRCPVLGSATERDLSHRVWHRKQRAWQDLPLTIVAPSRWIADCVRKSSLLGNKRIEVIPNGIDTARFKPFEKNFAREALSLPRDKKLILFGAKSALYDKNKGFQLFTQATQLMAAESWRDKVEVVIFGSSEPAIPPDLGLPCHYLGWLHDEFSLALLYAAADLLVLPSLQENLPYAAMEAMSCGTPVVAFRQGGVPEMIDHEVNGWLATQHNPSSLATGIGTLLENGERLREMGRQARNKVENEFALDLVTVKHVNLYQSIRTIQDVRSGAKP
jgi:glycosyltransferase involved in cell wall biosynthesis